MTGNAVAVRENKAALVAGSDVAAIVPRTLEETFRLAGALSASGMAPSTLNTPEKVMVAILAGAELGLPPFQALQSFAVINGRPALWGDGLIAVVRSHGMTVKEWIEGVGDQMTAHCVVTRPSGEEIARAFSVADAKTAKLWGKAGPWQSNPTRMLQMRARGFACRDGAADVLRGFQLREEVEDYQPLREPAAQANATGTGMRERLEARSTTGGFDADHITAELDAVLDGDNIPAAFDAPVDAVIENVEPEVDDFPAQVSTAAKAEGVANNPPSEGSPLSLSQRVEQFKKRVDEAPTTIKLKSMWSASAQLRTDLDLAEPEVGIEVEDYWRARYDALEEQEREGQ